MIYFAAVQKHYQPHSEGPHVGNGCRPCNVDVCFRIAPLSLITRGDINSYPLWRLPFAAATLCSCLIVSDGDGDGGGGDGGDGGDGGGAATQ